MIDASQLPRVPSEVLEQAQRKAPEYARAPAVPGGHAGPLRPESTQRKER